MKQRPALRFKSGADLRDFRRKLGLNQADFWSPVGVTQSGGSRYESGRAVPETVQILLTVAYGTAKQSSTVVAWLRKNA